MFAHNYCSIGIELLQVVYPCHFTQCFSSYQKPVLFSLQSTYLCFLTSLLESKVSELSLEVCLQVALLVAAVSFVPFHWQGQEFLVSPAIAADWLFGGSSQLIVMILYVRDIVKSLKWFHRFFWTDSVFNQFCHQECQILFTFFRFIFLFLILTGKNLVCVFDNFIVTLNSDFLCNVAWSSSESLALSDSYWHEHLQFVQVSFL